MEDWQFVMPGLHPGYIDWDRFKANQESLPTMLVPSAVRAPIRTGARGTRLLQGRVLCGLCGERMGVRYSQEHGQTGSTYVCKESAVRRGGKVCQSVPGKIVDPAIRTFLSS